MHSVWFLLFDESLLLDLCGPLQDLSMANQELMCAGLAPYYQTTLLGKEVRSYFNSARVEPDAQALQKTLYPPAGNPDAFNTSRTGHLSRWLPAYARQIARLASVPAGAFFLAKTGALAKRRVNDNSATCHKVAIAIPAVRSGTFVVHVRDVADRIPAGLTAGIDKSVATVEADLGRAIATNLANKAIAPCEPAIERFQGSKTRRGQLVGDPRIRYLCVFILANLNSDLSVPALAERMNMSRRTFARFFVTNTGLTPARAIEQMRIESACDFIEGSDRPIKWIAYTCGFGSSEMMRRAFVRNLRISPSEFRRRLTVDQEDHLIRRQKTKPNHDLNRSANGKSTGETLPTIPNVQCRNARR
ncbi:hypothetical protein AXG89_28190 (plasmid) [Burkholderia sp. PAMC 26561]|nr:hypothetical protein AXG89_24500 [Burkholderia sp. PAMC 26561]AME27753.1 hypothetical protein AXG89_28190 [Burkholderia sp. PAMC 26561]